MTSMMVGQCSEKVGQCKVKSLQQESYDSAVGR